MKFVTVARIENLTDTGTETIGVSDGRYIDLTSTSDLRDGAYLQLMQGPVNWAVHARHPYQDQAPELFIGELVLDNHSGSLDGLNVQTVEVQQGPAGFKWNDRADRWDRTEPGHLEAVLVARGGPHRWQGRESVTVELRNVLQPLSEPFAQQVFDEETPNETLINTLRPRPLGRVFQVRPPLTNPQLLRFFFDGDVGRVAEGGNPTENWLPSVDGIQLTQNFQQVITLDGAGPLLDDEQRDDVLEAIGSFETWSGSPAEPDGWTLTTDPPDSDLEEATGGGLDIIATAAIDDNTTDTAVSAQNPELQSGAQYEPISAATLAEALETAEDGKYVRFTTGSDSGVKRLWLSNFGVELPPDTIPVGVQLRIRYQSVGSTPSPYTRWRLGKLVDGSFEAIMPFSGDYAELPYNWPASWDTRVYGDADVLPFTGLTREQAESEDLAVQITFRRTTGTVDVQIDHVELLIHYGPLIEPPKAVTTDALLTPGDLYTLRVVHDGAGSVRLRWATVDATTDPVPVGADPFQPNQAQLDGPGTYEALVTATGPRLALEFDRGSGDGLQTIPLVQLIERGQGLSRYNAQVPFIVGEMGLDPELHVDQAMIDAHDDATGHLTLGWYINDSTSADDLLFRLAGSLGGAIYHGLDGRVHSFLVSPPTEPDNPDDHLRLEGDQIGDDVEIWHDDPPNITDRAVGAKNQHPIPESGLSTITSTWTESERQAAMAEWRVTRKVNWDDLSGFEEVSS